MAERHTHQRVEAARRMPVVLATSTGLDVLSVAGRIQLVEGLHDAPAPKSKPTSRGLDNRPTINGR